MDSSKNLIRVEDKPYEKFNLNKFYNQYGITPPPQDINSLTLEQAKEEFKKLTNVENHYGFAYFLIEYCTVSHPTLGKVILKDNIFKWQANAAIEFLQNRYVISLKSRQVAFSTTVGAYCLWRALFFNSQRIVIISKNQRDSTTLLERIKFMYENLPNWLKQKTSEFAKTYVSFAHNFSKITSLPNKGDPAQGESLSLLIADEFASYDDAPAVLNAATPALSAGSLTPFSNETLPSQFFIISTLPRNKVVDNDYLRILHGAQEKEDSRFKLIDVEVDDIPYYRSKEWHEEMLETLGSRGYKIEVLKEEVYETENALIEGAILQQIQTRPPKRCDFLFPEDVNEEGYYKDLNVFANMKDNCDIQYHYIKGLWIWEDPIEERQYCVTCDVSGGEANDFCAFHVFDLITNEQVAEYKGKVNTEIYKEILLIVAERYNNAKLSIERTGLGINICQYFGDTIVYPNLYWHKISKNRIVSGFPMVQPLRGSAIAYMENYITRGTVKINSIRLVNELRNFGMTSRGKMAAISGNDDLVMAFCQFCYLQEKGFAVSDEEIMENLLGKTMADFQEEDVVEVPKYWYDDVDMSEQDKELLKIMKATGSSINVNEYRKYKDEL